MGCDSRGLDPSGLFGQQGGKPVEVERPALVAAETIAQTLPALGVPLEIAVFEIHSGPIRCLGGEPHIDFTCPRQVGLELPVRADVPAEHDSVRWFVGEHPREAAFAAVDAAVVKMPANPRLEHRLSDLDREQVVLARLEVSEILREDAERALDWRLDDDRGVDAGACCLCAHLSSSTDCSTAVL